MSVSILLNLDLQWFFKGYWILNRTGFLSGSFLKKNVFAIFLTPSALLIRFFKNNPMLLMRTGFIS
jgi:hypothetical protein